MKFNSILFITFCLLQALICSTVGLNEQSLKDAATKTLKYSRVYHQGTTKLEDKGILQNVKFNYSPLTLDNIQFRFDEYGLLHIRFANLKATVEGNRKIGRFTSFKVFSAKINNFSWEQVFVVSKRDLGNGKLDIKYKPTEESPVNFSITLHNQNNSPDKKKFNEAMEKFTLASLKSLDFTPIKNQLKKVAQLILETLQSDLK